MATYNVSINNELAEFINAEIKDKKYASNSEFFRELVRERMLCNRNLHNYKETNFTEFWELDKNEITDNIMKKHNNAKSLSDSDFVNL